MSLKSQQAKDMIQKSHSFKGSYRLIVDDYKKACSCQVCDIVLKDNVDMNTFLEHGACSDCIDTYYYPNADKWNSGWRPKIMRK